MPVKSRKSVLFLRCPTCGKGSLFKNTNPYALNSVLDMNEHCEYCNEDFEVEPAFYQGGDVYEATLSPVRCAVLSIPPEFQL